MKMHGWTSRAPGVYGVFLLASAVYMWGLAPTIYWYDSPEFVTVAHTLGISHPAGSPTYSLLAKPLTLLPIGSIALRVNLFSALAGAFTVALLFALLYESLAASPLWIRYAAGLSGALFLVVSESFWRFAEVAEVYTLQNGFIVLLLYILLKARQAPPGGQLTPYHYYWLFAFLYGLSAGVHATMALCAPAFLIFMALTTPRMFRGKELAWLAFFFLLGFAVYLYLPVRSLSEPAFDWGDPETWGQFVRHVTDRKDATVHTVFYWRQLPHQLRMYLHHLTNEFSTLGLAVGLVGCLALLYREKAVWLTLVLILLGNLVFFMRTWWPVAWGFIPSFVIFALWIGFGVHACFVLLLTLYARYSVRLPRVAIYAFLGGGLTVALSQNLVQHAGVAKQTGNYATALYGKQLLDQLPPEAIIFTHYSWFPLLYLQQVERQRPDVTVILQGEVFHPRYFSFLSQQRFPNIRLVTTDQRVEMTTAEYFWRLMRLNAEEHPLFWDPDGQYQEGFDAHLLPQGLLFTLNPWEAGEVTPEVLRQHRRVLARSTNRVLQGRLERETATFLASKLNLIALYFKRKGLVAEAASMYQAALSKRPEDRDARNNYGNLLLSQGRLLEAFEQYQAAYGEDPINPMIHYNLGKLTMLLQDHIQAAHFFERALSFGPPTGDLHALLGETYDKLGRLPDAIRALETALQLYEMPTADNAADRRLREKVAWAQDYLRRLSPAFPEGPAAR